MNTEQLKSMCKRTIDFNNMDIPYDHVDEILDMCDDFYEENLLKEKIRHLKVERVFKIALGTKRFYEIRDALDDNEDN